MGGRGKEGDGWREEGWERVNERWRGEGVVEWGWRWEGGGCAGKRKGRGGGRRWDGGGGGVREHTSLQFKKRVRKQLWKEKQ